MKAEPNDLKQLAGTLERLRQELVRLGERVAALEAAVAPRDVPMASAPAGSSRQPAQPVAAPRPLAIPDQAAMPAAASSSRADGLDEELVLVISAAIAAFLGKRAHIRQIRLIGSGAWAQQGRVTIQASHALSVHSARART
jgi:methylmalonyl-CoA carboxyltransferase large subunit